MPPSKKGKSSATSATRKKAAAKAAAKKASAEGTDVNSPTGGPAAANKPGGQQRGQKKDKKSKKEPKKKVFIPPPKPPQPPPDPLDTLGLASLLPPGLVVLLRKVAKKDVTTRTRALESLLAWIDGKDEEESAEMSTEERQSALVMALPSWVHLFPRLAASPTRRLRLLTAQVLARLLAESTETRSELLLSPQYVEVILGPWSILAWDTDRATALAARDVWDKSVVWEVAEGSTEEDALVLADQLATLATYLTTLVLQGSSAVISSNEPQLSRTTSAANPAELGRDAKNRDDVNVEEDLRAVDSRMASGAMGTLGWIVSSYKAADECEELVNLLHSTALWTSLYSNEHASVEQSRPSVGIDFPVARSRAWSLLAALTSQQPRLLADILHVVAPIALEAAWEERDGATQAKMLDSLLPILLKHNEAWTIREDAEDSDSESDDDSDDDGQEAGANGAATTSPALTAFEKWIAAGCGGSPRRGLSYILVLVSTIPSSVLSPSYAPLSSFLNSFWSTHAEAGVYSSDKMTIASFFKSFTETATHLIGKASKTSLDDTAQLAQEQLRKVWSEAILPTSQPGEPVDDASSDARSGAATPALRSLQQAVDEKLTATLNSLSKLDDGEGKVTTPLLEAMSNQLTAVASGAAAASSAGISRAVGVVLALSSASAADSLRQWAAKEVSDLAQDAAGALQGCAVDQAALSSRLTLLSELLSRFPASHFEGVIASVGQAAEISLPRFVKESTLPPTALSGLLSAYLKVASEEQAASLLNTLFEAASAISDNQTQVQTLQGLLDGLESSGAQLKLSSSGLLDDVFLRVANELTSDSDLSIVEGQTLFERLLHRPQPLIEHQTVIEAIALLVSRLHGLAREEAVGKLSQRQLAQRIAGILGRWLNSGSSGAVGRKEELSQDSLLDGVVTAAFYLNFLVERPFSEAKTLWTAISQQDAKVHDQALETLRECLQDRQIETVVALEGSQRYLQSSDAARTSSLRDVLPSQRELQDLFLLAVNTQSPPVQLSLLDPLVGSSGPWRSNIVSSTVQHDVEGLGSHFRAAYTMLMYLEGSSRSVFASESWALPHLVLLAIACEDELEVTGGSAGLISSDVTKLSSLRLRALLDRSIKMSSSMLASLGASLPETWHATATDSLQKSLDAPQHDGLLGSLSWLWRQSLTSQGGPPSSYLTRVFSRFLAGVLSFSSAGEQEGTRWMRLATGIETKAPGLSEAIVQAAKPLVYGSPVYDRQRNDIVSRLASTPPSRANTEGSKLLRLAIAIAPPLDSDTVFVPPQRVTFLLQGLQKWMASDEDFDDSLNTLLAELLIHIVPLVQDLSGSHHDFFYDLIESNLEVITSLDDETTIVSLYHTLRLLDLMVDLSSRNAVLQEAWSQHEEAVLDLIKPIFISLASTPGAAARTESVLSSRDLSSVIKEMTADLLVGIVRLNQVHFFTSGEERSTLCHLLQSPMRAVQSAAYRLLSTSIRSSVKELVFESALEKEGEESVSIKIEPVQLLEAVRASLDVTAEDLEEESDGQVNRQVMAYLLAWLAILEHFEEASVQLKSIYASQLQSEGLIGASLLPTLFGLLEPQRSRRGIASGSQGSSGPFNPDRYLIDELFLDELDPRDSSSIRQLATHLYFRCLLYTPNMVREWFLTIKDRQLSLGVAQFTSRHCSPLIATRELSHLRQPEALERLQDEAMSIRVLASQEVVATYTVDEHPMEIAIKIPSDYPLHGIEVRDIKRVGVSEAQWRAWLLAVQQLIVGPQSGLVVDALMLFKRNAEAKFSGFEGAECSICYSIISPTDRSLPTKPCKTCSNKFHSSCLYKWVQTSGSSTCPLCRSIL